MSDDGRLSISSNAIPQVDVAFERQKRINDRLGGRMVTAYVGPGMDASPDLLKDISVIGFEVLIVDFESVEQFAAFITEVEEHELWDPTADLDTADNALLMATPLGFRRISTEAEFRAWLPVVPQLNVLTRRDGVPG